MEDYKLSMWLVLAVRTMCVEPPHDMCLPFVCYNEGLLCLIYDRGYADVCRQGKSLMWDNSLGFVIKNASVV